MRGFYGFCFGLERAYDILDIVKTELESCGIDLETLAGIIGMTGIILLLLIVTPLELLFRGYMLERVSVKTYGCIHRVLFWVALVMSVIGLVTAYYYR